VPERDRRILVVDHDESVLEAVGTVLRGRDHRIHTARDVSEAINLLERQEFDLIIADLRISEVSHGEGFEDWLAQHKPALSHNLIWMCAVTPPRAGEKTVRNSCQILPKPFKASDLIAAVDELVVSRVHATPVKR
jgi:DNA-binding NtrC family response regulator